MTAEPGRGMPADGSGNARASDADRERAADILSAAFADGRQLIRHPHRPPWP